MTAARWAYSHTEPAGADTGTLPIIPWYFVPLRIGDKTLGVDRRREAKDDGAPLDSEARALLDTLSEQTAAALDRASLAREMVSARRRATETERVRNTLLASVSHDFRTPLSSILGSATSLIDYGDKLDTPHQGDLLGQIKTEAEGLDEMVRNLLAITRIDAGALELRRDWIDLREIVERVVERGAAARRRSSISRSTLPPDLPLVRADATLAEQAIGNIVANAVVAYAAAKRGSSIDGRRHPQTRVALRDHRRRPGHCAGCAAAYLRQVRQGCDSPPRWRTAGRAPASGLRSPRASWRRMADRSGARARCSGARGAFHADLSARDATP